MPDKSYRSSDVGEVHKMKGVYKETAPDKQGTCSRAVFFNQIRTYDEA